MNCVYAISGTYGFLPRVLYYITLIFSIFGRRREWLVIGALVSALTYAGTSAIHQMAMVHSRDPVFDLDILGAWAVLSTGALAYIAMMHWSSTLRESKARTILVGWGFLTGVALIFGRTELFDQALADPEPACYSSGGQLLVYPIELSDRRFNCTYQCFSAKTPMRQRSETMVVPHEILKSRYMGFTKILVGPIQFAAYAALSYDTIGHTPSQHCMVIVMKLLDPKRSEELIKSIYNVSREVPYGGYIMLWHYIVRGRWSRGMALLRFVAVPWFILGLLVDIFALPMMLVNIVLNEITIMTTRLPTNEADYAIGQWGPWVSSALVIVAAVVNKLLELRDRAKRAKAEMKDEAAAELESRPQDAFELGPFDAEEGQTMGVVKPKLAHVPTLQDMEVLIERPKG